MNRAIIVALLAAGCATTSGAQSADERNGFKDQFPTRAALESIAAAPPPPRLAREESDDVDGWTLTGPLPDSMVSLERRDSGPWGQLLAQLAGGRPVTPTESMQCVAREEGLFFLAHRALPGERLGGFIAARCGTLSPDVVVAAHSGNIGAHPDEERLASQVRPALTRQLAGTLGGDNAKQAGIWFGERGGLGVVLVTVASRRAVLEPVAIVPGADGIIQVRGQLLETTAHVEGLINRGRYGFGRCAVDLSVPLPRFALVCKPEASDRAAWLEIAAFAPGRILGNVVARLLVFPSGAPMANMMVGGYVHREVPAGPDPRAQLLGLINEVRHQAGFGPVTLAERQSAVASQLAPHYFAALAGAEPETVADQIVLGVRAGWEVEGEVRLGNFAFGIVQRSDDLARLLDSVLERPSGREALLDRRASAVALGALVSAEQKVTALVAGSYQLFVGADHAADTQTVLELLAGARGMQLPVVRELAGEPQAAVARVVRGQSGPRAALQRMLNRAAEDHPGWEFHGYVLELSSLDELVLPDELVHMRLAGVAAAVGHYRPVGAPWSRLVVYILAATPPSRSLRASRLAHTF